MIVQPKHVHFIDEKQHQLKNPAWLWIGGVGFTFAMAFLGLALNQVPGFTRIGPMACVILLAVAYRQIWGYPEKIRSGIQFAAKKLLRVAIILFGLKLNIDVVIQQGTDLLVWGVGVIVFSISLTTALARWFKADASLSLLLGIGTGVCGAAAIAAVSPILKVKEEDTAMGIGIIALIGTLFSIGYTLLLPFLETTNVNYGTWSGVSLHEIAHVVLAATPAGQDALAMALLAKLSRVFLLIPLSFILMFWMKRSAKEESDAKMEFPWFLIGFMLMSLLGSYVLGKHLVVSPIALETVSHITTFLLNMAMVGLGLNVSFKDLRTKALRPLLVISITSVILSVLTFVSL